MTFVTDLSFDQGSRDRNDYPWTEKKYLLFEYFSLFEKTKNYKKVKMGIFLRRSGTIPFVEINIQFTE